MGTKNEKPEPVTLQDLEQNVEKTQGGGAAIAAEDLKKESMGMPDTDISDQSSQKGMKSNTKPAQQRRLASVIP